MNSITLREMLRLFDCGLTLVDDSLVQQLWFHQNGNVTATLGSKVEGVYAPILPWLLSADNHLVVGDSGHPLLVWTSVSFEGETLVVESSAGRKIYAITDSVSSPFASEAYTLYQQARIRMQAGESKEAIELLQQSVQIEPHFKTLELLGECLLRIGRVTEAIVPLAAATALNKQIRAPSLLAQAFLQLGDEPQALRFAKLVLESASGNKVAAEIVHALSLKAGLA